MQASLRDMTDQGKEVRFDVVSIDRPGLGSGAQGPSWGEGERPAPPLKSLAHSSSRLASSFNATRQWQMISSNYRSATTIPAAPG